jgi:peptide/nickel transport system substrate-binding protein
MSPFLSVCAVALALAWPALAPRPAAAVEISPNIAIQAISGEIPSLDPPYMLTGEDTAIGFNVYETLTRWDPDTKGVVPVLATSWESSEDGKVWTFRLREGVTFHDGSPFTAADVKASLDRNIKIGMVAYDFIGIESIDVVDDHTVRISASAPRNVPLIVSAQYGMFIYRADAAGEPPEWWAAGRDAGTGPYTIASFEPGSRAVLDYYPDYWGGWTEGQFTKIAYLIVEDPTVRDQMIRSGNADLTSALPFDSIASLEATDGIDVEVVLPLAQVILAFDLDNAPLDDVRVRRALALTFPHDDVRSGIYSGYGEVSIGAGPNALWNPPADFPRPRFDLDAAKALLEEAGHSDGFALNLAVSSGVKEVQEAVRLWQSELGKLGITLNIRELAGGAFWDNAYNASNTDYDVFVVDASGDVPSPYAWLVIFTPNGWFPAIGYKNEAFTDLVYEAWAKEATDADAAHALWVKAQETLHDDAVSIFAIDAPTVFAYKTGIKGFRANPPYSDIVFWYELSREG